MHASSEQLFTEEYQADFITAYWRVIEAEPACIGGQVWNFADFRTAQHHRRVQFNHKGVLTRTRDPKLAAWRLRELWCAP
jgi:beta-glucuronidase